MLAPALGTFYKALIAEGFAPEQALVLTAQYLHRAVGIVQIEPEKPSTDFTHDTDEKS